MYQPWSENRFFPTVVVSDCTHFYMMTVFSILDFDSNIIYVKHRVISLTYNNFTLSWSTAMAAIRLINSEQKFTKLK